MVLVSIIIPTYNRANLLKETIKSVLDQTYHNFELLIIDDGSTDNTKEVVESFKDKRIKYYFQENSGRPASPRNKGLKIAKGDLIAFLDSDDLWVKEKLETQLEILNKNTDLIVWNEGEIINQEGHSIGKKFTERPGASNKKKSGNIFLELLSGNFINFSSIIFKKENLGNLKFHERIVLGEDYLFLINLARDYKFYFINKPLVKVRTHPKNIINSNLEILINDLIFIKSYILDIYGNGFSRRKRWIICTNIIELCLGNKKKEAKPYIYRAIKIWPFNLLNFWYLSQLYINSKIILRIINTYIGHYQIIIARFNPLKKYLNI